MLRQFSCLAEDSDQERDDSEKKFHEMWSKMSFSALELGSDCGAGRQGEGRGPGGAGGAGATEGIANQRGVGEEHGAGDRMKNNKQGREGMKREM